ncbi:MAG TPA: membrane protein insertase YidC [Methylocystis sp.]|nr:membrane protein insertase YidC [Methylocystis sp.]
MTPHTKNMIIAAVLSLAFIAVWDFFVFRPLMNRQQAQFEQQKREGKLPKLGAPEKPAATAAAPAAAQVKPRSAALAESPRIEIDTRSLKGSVALKGAKIDDVSLKNYHETVDKSSPIIVLLSPEGGPSPYWADWGYLSAETENAPALPTTETVWTADGARLTAGAPVTLTWDNGEGLKFIRKISVDDEYMFTIDDRIENTTAKPLTVFAYSRVTRVGHPPSSGYAALHEGYVGVIGDLGAQEIKYDKIEGELNATKTFKGVGGWVGFTDKYWGAVTAPEQSAMIEARYTMIGGAEKTYLAETVTEPRTIEPGATVSTNLNVFTGAKEVETIDAYMERPEPKGLWSICASLGIEICKAKPGIKGFDHLIDWGWFYFITRPMFRLIDFLYKFLGNFGLAVLAVTVIVKGAFFPIANASYRSMAKIRAIQPKLKELKEKYGDDKHKLNMEQMELYKKEKINPVGGCVPMLLQIPVFFSLYKVLVVTIEMRQAPFFGWIKDLSAPDPTNVFNLFGLIPFDPTHMAILGPYLNLGVWPLLMGVTMWLQMKMNPEPTDEIQKTMFSWMPIIFTFTMGGFASGLVIYWTWNNLLSITQQWYIMTRAGVKFELWDNLRKTFSRA